MTQSDEDLIRRIHQRANDVKIQTEARECASRLIRRPKYEVPEGVLVHYGFSYIPILAFILLQSVFYDPVVTVTVASIVSGLIAGVFLHYEWKRYHVRLDGRYLEELSRLAYEHEVGGKTCS